MSTIERFSTFISAVALLPLAIVLLIEGIRGLRKTGSDGRPYKTIFPPWLCLVVGVATLIQSGQILGEAFDKTNGRSQESTQIEDQPLSAMLILYFSCAYAGMALIQIALYARLITQKTSTWSKYGLAGGIVLFLIAGIMPGPVQSELEHAKGIVAWLKAGLEIALLVITGNFCKDFTLVAFKKAEEIGEKALIYFMSVMAVTMFLIAGFRANVLLTSLLR